MISTCSYNPGRHQLLPISRCRQQPPHVQPSRSQQLPHDVLWAWPGWQQQDLRVHETLLPVARPEQGVHAGLEAARRHPVGVQLLRHQPAGAREAATRSERVGRQAASAHSRAKRGVGTPCHVACRRKAGPRATPWLVTIACKLKHRSRRSGPAQTSKPHMCVHPNQPSQRQLHACALRCAQP